MMIENIPEGVTLFEMPSYETALIGLSSDNRAIYDYDLMVSYLIYNDGMTEEEAEEFIRYNTLNSLTDAGSPIVGYFNC